MKARFLALLEEHRRLIYKVASLYARGDDRDDLAQEIVAQLWKAFPGYDEQRKVTTWMYRVALNVAISHARRRRPVSEELGDDLVSPEGAGDVRVRTLYRLIAGLGELDRALLMLYLDEHSGREIAEVLGISESNVATKIARLKERLRRTFQEEEKADG